MPHWGRYTFTWTGGNEGAEIKPLESLSQAERHLAMPLYLFLQTTLLNALR